MAGIGNEMFCIYNVGQNSVIEGYFPACCHILSMYYMCVCFLVFFGYFFLLLDVCMFCQSGDAQATASADAAKLAIAVCIFLPSSS